MHAMLTLVTSLLAASTALAQGANAMPETVVKEQYEWFNIWWDCANDPALPRVLLIGDSISCGYSPVVTKELQGKYHIDRLGTSRSINDPVLLQATEMMLEEYSYVAVHFNNGLHGFHLEGPAYAAALKEYVALIKRLAPTAKLIWGSSTPITRNGESQALDPKNEVVTARNTLAAGIMQEQGIPTDDLYSVVIGKPDLRSDDGYHYNGSGYEVLGKAVTEAVLARL
jgi:lysophospholipase L1-like esterase